MIGNKKAWNGLAGRLAAVAALMLAGQPASAQVREADLVHWAFAAYFGTGLYELGDGVDTYVLSLKPGYEWRESSLSESGERRLGYRLRVPVALGVHEFDQERIFSNARFKNVSTLSFVPGVEIEVPVSERIAIKPIAYLGYGTRIDGSGSSWIHWAGLKSQIAFERGKTDWMLVNSLIRIGYSPDSAPSGKALPFLTGFEFRRPLANKRIGGDPVYLNWHVSYTHYLDELSIDEIPGADRPLFEVDGTWELGVGFSKGDERLKLWRLRLDRFGFAYRFDSDGNFSGIRFVFKSLFDR